MDLDSLIMLKRLLTVLLCLLVVAAVFTCWMVYHFIKLMRRQETQFKDDMERKRLARLAPDELAERRKRKGSKR